MGLSEKIRANQAGILLYGMTPPKSTNEPARIDEIAKRALVRIKNAPIDGIVLYDLQDESARNSEERTFEFIKTISPQEYYRKYFALETDAVIYQAVGQYDKEELEGFFDTISSRESVVLVGASSKNSRVKTRLGEAYDIYRKSGAKSALGGICIPERHTLKHDEHLKVAAKVAAGCRFFISQAVYDLAAAKKFIDDYASLGCERVPLIFTFTPCGSERTLEFMRWLGICVPDFLANRLKNSDDMLSASCELCLEMFKFLFVYGRLKGISVGANVESVSTRLVEIEAANELLKNIAAYLGR
ncbi:methylenetetrahydrofolate reductase [Campylobacter sp. 19-13652]|uniref:methylenetetrahydrofolate reductase n=1 Tax=Campylobacter sp. 19-13652 TaxID=2840180 RepID=UPI001C76C0C7|nr:methylenetetrahydrofolate reductase [Campylobacter sp. 19-13652]BCX78888.1 hypothetical protein LBC_03500 [Campylobacter sp. 19-13652]